MITLHIRQSSNHYVTDIDPYDYTDNFWELSPDQQDKLMLEIALDRLSLFDESYDELERSYTDLIFDWYVNY